MNPGRKRGSEKRALTLSMVVTLAVLAGVFAGPNAVGAPQSLGGITLEEVRPRVFTPNGDSFNDVVFFVFDTSVAGLPLEADIRDLRGARIAGLELNAAEDALTWDGRTDGGRVAPTGVYIYSIKLGQNLATGTVVLAN
jgi:hypothetical protein